MDPTGYLHYGGVPSPCKGDAVDCEFSFYCWWLSEYFILFSMHTGYLRNGGVQSHPKCDAVGMTVYQVEQIMLQPFMFRHEACAFLFYFVDGGESWLWVSGLYFLSFAFILAIPFQKISSVIDAAFHLGSLTMVVCHSCRNTLYFKKNHYHCGLLTPCGLSKTLKYLSRTCLTDRYKGIVGSSAFIFESISDIFHFLCRTAKFYFQYQTELRDI